MIAPGSWLGLLGGGQLGRMFTLAAQALGYRVVVLDPADYSPAGSVADGLIRAQFDDEDGLSELAQTVSAVTTEFENISAETLRFLERHVYVRPSAGAVEIAQDRAREKNYLRENNFRTAPFELINNSEDVASVANKITYPGLLKASRFGYDGKGQVRVNMPSEIGQAHNTLGLVPCVFEEFLDLDSEISVILSRDSDGNKSFFPVAENQHVNGILDVTIAPARISDNLVNTAKKESGRLADSLDYCGVLCVEFFVLGDGSLVINEIAPRPHNSGHFTIDACTVSQFEQQVRLTAGLPQGEPQQHSPAVMINLLGDLWEKGEPAWKEVLSSANTKLHLYGKEQPRVGRKMGHLTVLGDDLESTIARAINLKKRLVKE